jgi:uncharacterized protein (DUF983 family)
LLFDALPAGDATMGLAASPTARAWRGCCPQYGSATLFASLVHSALQCRVCPRNLTSFHASGRVAAFLGSVLAAGVAALGLQLKPWYTSPLWVHLLLWVPLTAAAIVASVRLLKAMMLASPYRVARGNPALGIRS